MCGMFSSHLGWKVPWPLLAARVVKFRFISLQVLSNIDYWREPSFRWKGQNIPVTIPLKKVGGFPWPKSQLETANISLSICLSVLFLFVFSTYLCFLCWFLLPIFVWLSPQVPICASLSHRNEFVSRLQTWGHLLKDVINLSYSLWGNLYIWKLSASYTHSWLDIACCVGRGDVNSVSWSCFICRINKEITGVIIVSVSWITLMYSQIFMLPLW